MTCERDIDGIYDLSRRNDPSVMLLGIHKISRNGCKPYCARKYQSIIQAEDMVESSNVRSESHGY